MMCVGVATVTLSAMVSQAQEEQGEKMMGSHTSPKEEGEQQELELVPKEEDNNPFQQHKEVTAGLGFLLLSIWIQHSWS